MELFGVALTVIVMITIAAAVLVFERRRARRIERDLSDMARRRREDGSDDGSGAA